MKKALRIAGLVLIAAVAVAGGFFLVRGGGEKKGSSPGNLPPFPVPESNRTCKECHPEIYLQWEASYHALAWDDPQLQVAGIRIKEHPDCWPCHIPGPVFLSGYGFLPQARSLRRSAGVDCIACHYTLQGMSGKVQVEGPPCKPVVADPGITSQSLCSGCHNQHKTHDEWTTSRFHPDTGCNECHMPWVEGTATVGKPPKRYRAHTWPGCHELEQMRKAITVTVKIEAGNKAVIEVVNDGAGHNFPTDARFHRADLVVDVVLPSGQVVNQFEEKYKNPFRVEPGPNTQIKPGEKKAYRWRLKPEGVRSGTLRVRILYCLQPYPGEISEKLKDNHHVLLKEIKVPIQ